MKIQELNIEQIIPYAKNPRQNDEAIAKVASSLKEFGWRQPIVVDKEMVVIAGHTRLGAAMRLGYKKVPIHIATDLTDNQIKAYRIADNRVGQEAKWDEGLLSLELKDLDVDGYDLTQTGFDSEELDVLLAEAVEEGLVDEDQVPPEPEEATSVLGDVWLLGNHRVMCGDSTNFAQVELLMNNKIAKLIHADPPYGMGKEKDGVLNDNLYKEKLDNFQMEWWQAFRPYLENNASAYIWGNAEDLWRLWHSGGLGNSEKLTFRNEIVWSKNTAQGINSDNFRMYPTSTERALFFMLGEQGFNNNADNYWDGWDFVVNYLKQEKEKSRLSIKDFKRIAGHSENSGCHWFDKSQWNMPTKEVYQSWQNYMKENNNDTFKKEYDELKKEHDELKKEFYLTRSYFNNTHENMTDVWQYQSVTGKDRQGHATPKPVEIMQRIMNSSLTKDGLCIEPFGGSGSTLIGAEKTNKICYTMELDPKYVDVIVQRWQDFTGKKATHQITNKTFDEMKNGKNNLST